MSVNTKSNPIKSNIPPQEFSELVANLLVSCFRGINQSLSKEDALVKKLEQLESVVRKGVRISPASGLGKEIEEFFAKDPDSESVFRSFSFWTKLADVSRYEVRTNNEIISLSGVEDSSQRILTFRQGSYEVLLALDESSLITDSDFKGNLLESGSMALMRRLEQLELN